MADEQQTLTYTRLSDDRFILTNLDNYCTFSWCGRNMLEDFNAFIVNKDTLRFYNGPSFSNEYTKPQFESSSGQLIGVSFNVQKINFTMGVYGITEQKYRELIHLLSPYTIGALRFDFDQEHYYQVKLAGIEDSTRNIIGKKDNNDLYYTELNLSFEVVGPNCAYNANGYEFNIDIDEDQKKSYKLTNNDMIESDLDFPVEIQTELQLETTDTSLIQQTQGFFVLRGSTNNNKELFNVVLDKLAFNTNSTSADSLVITYKSDQGILLCAGKILNLLTVNSDGDRIVKTMNVNKYYCNGSLTSGFNPNLEFTIQVIDTSTLKPKIKDVQLYARGRTNII